MDFGTLDLESHGCFMWDLMSHPSRNMEDFVAVNDLNCANLAQEVSVKNFNMWPFLWYFGEEHGNFLPSSEEST